MNRLVNKYNFLDFILNWLKYGVLSPNFVLSWNVIFDTVFYFICILYPIYLTYTSFVLHMRVHWPPPT